MIIRQCKHCKKDVEVFSKNVTNVICDDCRIKMGYSPKKAEDTDEFIYCRICNECRRRLDLHLKTKHLLTTKEYGRQFPNAPIYAKNCVDRRKRDATSRKCTSEALKASWANEEVKKRRVQQIRLNPPAKGMHHSYETKLKLAKASDYKHSIKGRRKDIKFCVRSMNEANFCRMLDFCNVNYEYETKHFLLSNGKVLFIDFYLYENFEMLKAGHIELKGWKKADGYYFNKEKFDLFGKEYPQENAKLTMIFPTDNEFKFLENKYKQLIPMWETGKKNLYTHPVLYARTQIAGEEESPAIVL